MSSPSPQSSHLECIFCRIGRGEARAHVLHEDEQVLAFLDLFPVSEGHLLVVPRAHCDDVFDAEEEGLVAVMRQARRLAHALKRALRPDGLAMMQLSGAAAGQTVFHYHLHLIPRWHGDPMVFHGRRQGEDAALKATALRIREALASLDAGAERA